MKKVTKLTDLKFNGQHPNKIDVGYTVFGKVTILNQLYVDSPNGKFFRSSDIVKVEENKIYTKNSVYLVEDMTSDEIMSEISKELDSFRLIDKEKKEPYDLIELSKILPIFEKYIKYLVKS